MALVYEDVLKGNITLLQDMIQMVDPRVEEVTSSSSKMTGSAINLGLSTPFIQLASWNYNKGKFYEVSDVKVHASGAEIKSEYGIYSSGTSSNLGKKERNAIKAFYAGVSETKLDGKKYYDTKGTFVWSYETNNGTAKKLKRAVRRLVNKTYLYEELPVIVPQTKGKLNYTKVDMQINFSKSYTEHLMTLDVNNFKYDLMAQVKYDCKKDRECLRRNTQDVKSSLSRMFKRVKEMKKFYGNNNKKFVKAYADFGKMAFKNKYVFKRVYDEAKSCGLTLNYTITGEKIHRLEKQFMFAKTASCKK
jgi:hypothetical protein